MLDAKDIKDIIHLVDRSSFKQFRFENDQCKLELQKEAENGESVDFQPVQDEKTPSISEEKETSLEESVPAENEVSGEQTITSTMVGTFYSSSQPDSNPFVTIGDYVETDTVVGVVEAMKLFNEVEANVEGEITDILVEDGDLVEHGQPLFKVKKP